MSDATELGFINVGTAPEAKDAAVDLDRRAVEARLAAGAQVIGPVTSVFWHLGEFGTGEVRQLLLQSHTSRYAELEALLLEHHPWDNPELTDRRTDRRGRAQLPRMDSRQRRREGRLRRSRVT